ncbi:ORF6C domain-containing protein [Clostridium paraputrificum]|uniref:ORF6C domain-containing protein n=2 Tax=Clostridium paraputrificum TaxID=29363 RepID=UPI00325AAECC
MNNQIVKINGLKEVEGMKFHDIEGGFGEGKKAMLVKEIANIHRRELKVINQNINNNISRFKKGIDIVDLKNGHFELPLQELGFSNRDISISKNIYLLSERGYAKLLKILEDDVAWEQYEKLVDGYFNMRGQARPLTTEEMLELQFKYAKEVKEEVKEVRNELEETNNKFDNFIEDLPLIGDEPEELQAVVRRAGTKALGGYNSPAYCDKSLSKKVYRNVWDYIKGQFNVKKYKAIKRKYLSKAIELAESYKAPFHLQEEIDMINNQSKLDV